jgi:hypothetical protein
LEKVLEIKRRDKNNLEKLVMPLWVEGLRYKQHQLDTKYAFKDTFSLLSIKLYNEYFPPCPLTRELTPILEHRADYSVS